MAALGANPGFETDTADWYEWVGTLTRDTAVKRTGAASGRYNVPAGTWWGGLEYLFTAPAVGASTTVSAWVRTASGAPDLGAVMVVVSRDGSGAIVDEVEAPVPPTSGAWVKHSLTFTPTQPDCALIFEFDTGDAITFWVDDVDGEVVGGTVAHPLAGTSAAVSGASGAVTVAGAPVGRPYFEAADWYWDPIPPSPVLHDKNTTWSGYLADGQHPANLDEYANAIVYLTEIDSSTPRYSVAVDYTPAWGPNPFAGYQIPIPVSARSRVAPFTGVEDSWLIIADPSNNRVFHLWQARWTGSTWRASWGGVSDIAGDGRDDITGSGLSNFGGTIRLAALQAAAAANTGLGHALQFSSDATAGSLQTEFVYPATKTDGHLWPPDVADPIWEGTRIQLDPAVNVDALPGITAAEKVIAKTLQEHGAYLIDNGGARAAFMFERQANGNISGYSALGLGWDYFDLDAIPWGSVRVLRHWHGGATLEGGPSSHAVSGTAGAVSGVSGVIRARLRVVGASTVLTGTTGKLAGAGLSGTSAVLVGATGQITARFVVAGTVAVASAATGRLASPGLSGTVQVVSGVTGRLVPAAAPPGPPPTDFGLRLACYDPGGTFRGHARGMLIERYARAGEVGRLLVDFSEQAPRGAMFATHQGGQAVGLEVAVEYYDGTDWVEPHNGRYLIGQDQHERVEDPTGTHDLTLLGYGVLLNGAKVWAAPEGELQTDGKRQFLSRTPGQIIGTLITEAQARGALPGIMLGFTATHDSAGSPWPAIYNRAYELSHSVLGILQNLYDGGAVDYWWEGRELNMVPAGGYSRDLSVGSDPVYLRDLRVAASPERDDWTRLASVAKLIGDEGFTAEKPNPAAVTPFGRQETVILAGGVSDPGTASLMMDRALAEGADVAREITREWSWTETTRWMPDRDIRLGDWVLADTIVGTRQRVKVADLMTRQGPDGIEAFVTLGTVADDALTRMAKRQVGIEGGAGVGSIGRPTQPPPPDPTERWPERPTGLSVTVSAWPIPGGYGGVVGASWDAVTTDTEGYALDVDGYVVRGRRVGGPWMDLFRTSSLSGQVERTDMRPGETWEVAVAAYWTDRTGIWTTSWSGTVPEDTQAPPVPSQPILDSPVAELVVTWDGLDATGSEMPLDLKQVEVQLDAATDPEKWKISYTGGSLRLSPPDITLETVYTVRLRAVDFAGNASGWSEPAFIGITASVAWPAVPASVLASAESYLTPEGAYRGRISASWAEVTEDVDGHPLDIAGYAVRVRRTDGLFPVDWFDLGGTPDLSFSGSSELMQVGDTWEVSVAAVSTDGHTGPFSTAVTVEIPPDTVPPSVPSVPLVSSALGMLTVEWDGLSQAGGGMEPDLDHLLVHITGLAETWRLDPVARVLHIPDMPVGTLYEVRLSAVDRAGNASGLSQPASATITSAISGLQSQIDQVESDFAAADQALQNQIDSIVVSQSGGVVTWMGGTTPEAPSERPHLAGDLWWDTATNTQKRYDGTDWVVFQLGRAGISSVNASAIFGLVEAAQIKTDAAWVQGALLVGSADEMIVDPTWQNADLNASRTRTGWTVEPGTVTHTQAVAEDFYLGIVSDWSDARSRLTLRPGVRYRVVATVRLTTAGQVSLVQRDTNGAYSYIAGPVSLAANVDYGLVGTHEWGQYPGTFGVRMDQPGTIRHVSIRPMLSQVLIQDGLITAPKIASEAVTADKLTAGAVTAAKLHADALDFKWARGLRVTGGLIETTEAAYRGIKLTSTDLRAWDSAGTQTFHMNAATGGVAITGELKSSGAYPRIEITKNVGGTGYAGIQFEPGPGWNARPWLRTNAVRHGTDTPGSFYLEGASSTDLTMKPSLILRSGTVVSGTDRYWPQIEMRLGRATHFGHIRIADIGERKTDINMWADFYSLTTKTGQSITMPVPGTVGDIRIWSTNGAVHLNTGNGWLMLQGIGSTTGGQDLALEGGWRAAYRSSLSRDKLDQAPIGALYELLELTPATWVDRARRERDPAWDTRYGGLIFEDVERVSARHGGSLDFLLIRSAGAPSGVASAAVAPALIGVVADMHDRLTRLEEAL